MDRSGTGDEGEVVQVENEVVGCGVTTVVRRGTRENRSFTQTVFRSGQY